MEALTTQNDTFQVGKLLEQIFPKAVIVSEENFDDMNFGYDVGPEPGEMIRVKISMDNPIDMIIAHYRMNASLETVRSKIVFSGTMPPNKDATGIDIHFLTQLLRNYKRIG